MIISPQLKFDDDGHRYYLEYAQGAIEDIPSVSEILKPLENYSMVNADLMDRACEYGTNVHKAIELWLKGVIDEASLDDGLKKPLAGFKAWHVDNILRPCLFVFSEKRHYHPKLKYAGTIDLEVCGKSIVDFKTRKFNPIVDPVRLAAYKGLYPEFPPLETHVLEIDIEGNCKLINAYHRQAWSVFRKLLDFHNRKKEFEIFIAKWKGK